MFKPAPAGTQTFKMPIYPKRQLAPARVLSNLTLRVAQTMMLTG